MLVSFALYYKINNIIILDIMFTNMVISGIINYLVCGLEEKKET